MPTVNDDYPKNQSKVSDNQLKELATQQYERDEVKAHDFPTEIIELPSKGLLYPEGHPLRSGTIEMKYMTAKEEDILSNQSFIKQGVVLDKLFKSLIVSNVPYDDLLLCDKNAIMIAARVLGYGKEYPVTVTNPDTGDDVEHVVDLTTIKEREIDWDLITPGKNSFDFELPASKRTVTLRLLTHGIQRKIDAENKALEKVKRSAPTTTLLKYAITAIDGDTDTAEIRKFVDNQLLAIDSRAIRVFLKKITPDVDMVVQIPDGDSGDTFPVAIAVGVDFFWPDANI